MDYTSIVTLVSTVGFPIVCVVFLWNYVNTTMRDFTKSMQENTKMLEKLSMIIDSKVD